MLSLPLVVVITIFTKLSSPKELTEDATNDDELLQQFRELMSEFLQRNLPSDASPKLSQVNEGSPLMSTSKSKMKRDKSAQERAAEKPSLSPLYNCSHFDVDARTCRHVRQLGTTLTIGVRVEAEDKEKYKVHWYRFFKLLGQEKNFTHEKLARDALPWNVNIGGDNCELRISPITETDFSYNFFLATLNDGTHVGTLNQHTKKDFHFIRFSIEPIYIDMGTLYHGEEIVVNVRSHMELPARSLQFEWATVDENYDIRPNLPSNMRISRDGSEVIIKEHRSYRDMIITCAVYSNKYFHLGRRKFFLKRIAYVKSANVMHERREPDFLVRKKRYLEDFYVPPDWNEVRPSHSKRSSYMTRDLPPDFNVKDQNEPSNGTAPPNEFPEIDASREFISQASSFKDFPQQTELPFLKNAETQKQADLVADYAQPEIDNKIKIQSLNEMIKEANNILETESPAEESTQESKKPTVLWEPRLTFEDKESQMISNCNDDLDCGINAVCYKMRAGSNFCRCKPHYRGNGMFCWLF